MAPNGSIRSVHSVPMLAANSVPSMPPMSHTWDGEPCPVHHQPAMPLAALYGLGPQMVQGPSMPGTPHMDHKSFHGSMMIRGNPKMVFSAENGAPSHLPMRDKRSTLPPGSTMTTKEVRKETGIGCCSGHFVVLWIILGIITFGVLLSVVLMFTVA